VACNPRRSSIGKRAKNASRRTALKQHDQPTAGPLARGQQMSRIEQRYNRGDAPLSVP
jgi:hypothetical protein